MLKNPVFRPVKKGAVLRYRRTLGAMRGFVASSAERRARNRRAEAYLRGTLERGGRAQRSRWAFFNGLLVNRTTSRSVP